MRLNNEDTIAALKERRGTRRKRRRFDPAGVPLEHEEQGNLMKRAFAFKRQIPELEMLFAIPNQGAARLKNLQTEGVMRGVPDLFLAVHSGPHDSFSHQWGGLFIEMKRVKGGKISLEQNQWANRLTEQGYLVQVAYGCEDAWTKIMAYLGRAADGSAE